MRLGNGMVDIDDLTIVLTYYGQSTLAGSPGKLGWKQGNFNGGPGVDINDLTIVLANYGETASASGPIGAVPEPATVPLALAGLLALAAVFARWRWRNANGVSVR